MRRLVWTLIAIIAIGVVCARILPPAPERVDTNGWTAMAARTVSGAYHIHTTRSDGHGDKHDVAAAAARAGRKFVILTDHGDGTRPPDPPEYVDGVLCLDAVEISTAQGHLVALDMPRAPYPLGGAADAVVEDVHRLGGFAIAAHPDSPKPALQWTDTTAPIDGIEWLNADSEWRKDSRARLIRAGLAYFLRPGPALAALLDRPQALQRWDRLTAERRVVGFAAADAHGGVGRPAEDTSRSLAGTIGIPSYEASFRTFSNRVVLDAPLSGDPERDARSLYAAIRQGSVFTTIDAVAAPGFVETHLDGAAIIARATRPRGAEIALIHGGMRVASADGDLRYDSSGKPGAYRIEIQVPSAPGQPPIPWLVANPVYVSAATAPARGAPAPGAPAPGAPAPGAPAPSVPEAPSSTAPGAPSAPVAPIAPGTIPPFPWRIEKDPASSAIVRATAHAAELDYRLAPGERDSQFVALATDIRDASFTTMRFGLQADRPCRVSVQVRAGDGRRWGRSYYVDPAGSELEVRLSALRPVGEGATGVPDARALNSLLLVIDLTNAAPGQSGRLHVLSSALVK